MTPRMLKQTLEEWSREVRVPADLADRALRRRSRLRLTRLAGAVSCAAAVAAVALLVPLVVIPHFAVEPISRVGGPPVVVPVQPYRETKPAEDVMTDTGNSPPKRMIAAGRVAVSAYFTWRWRTAGGRKVMDRTWYLLDQVTGTYEKTDWGWVEVAPGLRWAAVLEKALPVRRIGIFDMEVRRVRAWVPVDRPVGGLAWSPDGTRLLATAYDDLPDLDMTTVDERQCPTRAAATPEDARPPRMISTSRTGFYVVDVATATAGDFHAVDPCLTDNSNVRRDFGWSDDGTLVREASNIWKRPDAFYDLEGRPHDAPAGYVVTESKAGVSPDGTLLAGPDGMPTKVTELSTGRVVGRQQVLQLLAWADDRRLVALGCAGACGSEFHNGLVLVSVDGEDKVQLSVYRKNSQKPEEWHPVLTLR
ncbi:hypothetical protein GCM10010116_17100 [Microbispora rosea subsp. aerata]|nr:hypothetical protein [Microbispora rosea]GGO08453.1 hypothetical protein GCM10010116_17100 [Microbispora rosea subsp. aerata]GIH55406.1 hypothetical protein Mro02_23200 [Microbispora rosea subsp. aerata]GLJ84603.1 hypothetical protein GCM10017588_33310 [Microbispora rosea subsp. aerata]